MAKVHNPSAAPTFCHGLWKIIGPKGTVTCSNEEAKRVSTVVFLVQLDPDEPETEVEDTDEQPNGGVQGVVLQHQGMQMADGSEGVYDPDFGKDETPAPAPKTSKAKTK